MSLCGRKQFGSRVIIEVPSNSTAKDIITKATFKMKRHNANFNENDSYTLHYPNGSQVIMLLESDDRPFTLSAYKEEILKDYSKISLFLKGQNTQGRLP